MIVLLFETKYSTFGINEKIQNFWFSDFHEIQTRDQLEDYLTHKLTEKFYNQDEYGNVVSTRVD